MKLQIGVLGLYLVLLFSGQETRGQQWDELLKKADSLNGAAAFDSAIVFGEQALLRAEEEFGPVDSAVASICNRLGIYHLRIQDYQVGEELIRRSLEIRQDVLNPDDPRIGWSLLGLANAIGSQGDYVGAEPLYFRAVEIIQAAHGPEHPDVAEALRVLSLHHLTSARYTEAESLLVRVLHITEKVFGPEHPSTCKSLNDLGNVNSLQGRYSEAEPYYTRMRTILEKTESTEKKYLGLCLNNLAELYHWIGRLPEAESLFIQARQIKEETYGVNHGIVASSVLGLAKVYRDQGRYEEAEPLYKRCIQIREENTGPNHLGVATALDDMGSFYSSLGRLDEALPLFDRALRIRTGPSDRIHPDVATSLHNLAVVNRMRGNYAKSESLLKKALSIREEIFGQSHPIVAENLHELAILYQILNRIAESEQLCKRALDIRQECFGPHHPGVALSLELACELARINNDSVGALEFARQAVNARLTNLLDNVIVMSEKDALTYSRLLKQAVDLYLTSYFESNAQDYTSARSAADIIIGNKGLVSDAMHRRQQVLVRETDPDILARARVLKSCKFRLSRLFAKGDNGGFENYPRALDSLQRRVDSLEADLSRFSASFRKREDREHVSIDRLRSLIPENTILIEYYRLHHAFINSDSSTARYVALVVSQSADPVVVDLGDASEIDRLAHQYHRHMLRMSTFRTTALPADQDEFLGICADILDRVWKPIEKFVPNDVRALIAPDGGLNLVSFATLVDRNGKYLVEKLAIHCLSSSRDIVRLASYPGSGTGLLAMGDPDYDATVLNRKPGAETSYAKHGEGEVSKARYVRKRCGNLADIELGSLPGTKAEIESISAQWKQNVDEPVVALTGSEASEDRFKREAPGKRVIHLATHGYFFDAICSSQLSEASVDGPGRRVENPLLRSGLFFAGANLHGEGADSANMDDGILTAYEVSAMDLEGAELVVLSACESGLGQIQSGEGVFGLRRAFQMAGARTVISALWPVTDQVTAKMLSLLYDRHGESAATSMRQLQLDQIKVLRDQGKQDHPFQWGALTVFGDW